MGPSLGWGDDVRMPSRKLQVAPTPPRAYLGVNKAKGAP
jgi:hypothetical protein